MLYFASGTDVWAYNTQSRKVSGAYAIDARILGLGLSGDGQRLYVAGAGRSLVVLDTASGSTLGFSRADEVAHISHN